MIRSSCLLAVGLLLAASSACLAAGQLAEQVRATNQFEYSYSTETEKEIVENWLDVSYLFGSFRTGLLLNNQQPAEEGDRENTIRHRFFEFSSGQFDVRVGHFYGLFGRGLVFAAYEDRAIRVDTALDGAIISGRHGPVRGTVFSGTPSALDRDVRAIDTELDVGWGALLGGTALTYRSADLTRPDRSVFRDWVTTGRLAKIFSFGDCYFEYGWKQGYSADELAVDPADPFVHGHAFYGGVNLFSGPVALACEGKSYRNFTVLPRSDGAAALNRPPALTREHIYSLLNRAPLNLDADDERGLQAELTWANDTGWSALANANRTERHGQNEGFSQLFSEELLFEEAYLHVEKDDIGDFRLKGAFGYQDSEGLRQTIIGEVTWRLSETRSLELHAEHQHVRVGGGFGFDLGEYDQEYFELEYAVAPKWVFSGILEVNNKYDEQQAFGEKDGPFPAMSIAYASTGGSAVNLWAGRRQAGWICSGGVCKVEPAFEGIELFGVFRY